MAALLGALMLTSCQAATPDSSHAAASASATASPTATPPTGKPPTASVLWADATRSLSKRHTVHFHDWFGSATGSSTASLPVGTIVEDFDVTLDGARMHGTQEQPGGVPVVEMLTTNGHHYEKYDDEMLRNLAGSDAGTKDALVKRVGGRWVDLGVEKSGDGSVRLVTHLLDPKHPAVTAFAAKATTVTATTFAGRSAWKIRSGDGKHRAWVAADASHDLLRVESAAATTRETAETIELSRFDVPFTTPTPHDTVPYSVIEEAMNASSAKR